MYVCCAHKIYSSLTRLLFLLIRSFAGWLVFYIVFLCEFVLLYTRIRMALHMYERREWWSMEAQRRLTLTTQLQLPVSSMFEAYLRILDIAHSTPQNVIYNQTNRATLFSSLLHTPLLSISISRAFFFLFVPPKKYPCILLHGAFFHFTPLAFSVYYTFNSEFGFGFLYH